MTSHNDEQINSSKEHTTLIFMFLKYKVKILKTARRNRGNPQLWWMSSPIYPQWREQVRRESELI